MARRFPPVAATRPFDSLDQIPNKGAGRHYWAGSEIARSRSHRESRLAKPVRLRHESAADESEQQVPAAELEKEKQNSAGARACDQGLPSISVAPAKVSAAAATALIAAIRWRAVARPRLNISR